jgi:hypothetical protein
MEYYYMCYEKSKEQEIWCSKMFSCIVHVSCGASLLA